jgi:acetyl esterase/lipase
MRRSSVFVLAGALSLALLAASNSLSPHNRLAADEPGTPDPVLKVLGSDAGQVTMKKEVVYGRKLGVALTFDVFTPKKDANGAGVVTVVSGGWVSDRELFAPFYMPIVRALVKRGYTVFTVCHACQPRFTIPEVISDIQRGVRFIRLHARDYGIDPERLGITGGSAGGHLSLMMGTTGDGGNAKEKDALARIPSRVAAVACFFPPTDFLNYGAKGEVAFTVNGTLANFRTAVDVREMDPKTKRLEHISDEKALKLYRQISPITHISAQSAPTLIIHGDADKLVPIQQAESFLAKLKEAGVPTELVVKKGAGHGWAGMDKDADTFADWFDKHLKKK